MGGDGYRASRLEDLPGPHHLVGGAMSDHQQKLVRLERRLVLHDAVLGNANAVQRGAQGTEPPNHHGAFQNADNPGDQRAEHEKGTDARDEEHGRPEEQAP